MKKAAQLMQQALRLSYKRVLGVLYTLNYFGLFPPPSGPLKVNATTQKVRKGITPPNFFVFLYNRGGLFSSELSG